VETETGENHISISYIYQELFHRKNQLPNYRDETGRRLQPPILGLQPEGIYNYLNSLAPNRRRIQPRKFFDSNLKEAPTA
jgi:hypothetical protein